MIFPVHRFWTFSPWGWCAAVVWNVFELLHVRIPFAHVVFGVIVGAVPHRLEAR
jgi:hypothetical protein